MGEVYLAADTKFDRKVAIKFLSAESIADERAKSRLFREARAAAKLDHPNICSIYEVAEEDSRSFIVMQYVEGETLAKLIQPQPLALRQALDIAVQIAGALAEAHSRSRFLTGSFGLITVWSKKAPTISTGSGAKHGFSISTLSPASPRPLPATSVRFRQG